ncbi:MAG: 50S ribosomal protein L22 [Oscillospiraceae bacterium]|nr:50S ribosomal protein L22 [Oscillospiraceae bacterium]
MTPGTGTDIRDARAHLKYARISPRKVKIVLDLIRGKDVGRAAGILKTTPKSASEYLFKLLNSAVANAENNHRMDPSRLYVSECFVCPGPIMKRVMPRAQGRAFRINKRMSHITIAVKEKAE